MQCLERCGFDYENDTLIQLGDIVDGHPQTFECIEELLKIKNLVAIRGNHDQWFYEFIQMDYHPMQWNFGGDKTAISYLKHIKPENNVVFRSGKGYKTSLNASDIPDAHRRFFAGQLLYYIDDLNRCFVHAGFDTAEPFYGQIETNYYFDRSLWMDAMETGRDMENHQDYISKQIFSEIYIGHTPTMRWNTDKPMKFFNITDLDTGASHSGRLTIMDIDNKQYWQSDLVGNLYPDAADNIKISSKCY